MSNSNPVQGPSVSPVRASASWAELKSSQPIALRLFDSDKQPVGRGVGRLQVKELPAGLYRMEIRAGISSKESLIKLLPGQTYTDHALAMPFLSVLPLRGASNRDQSQLDAWRHLSDVPTFHSGGNAELPIFVRVVKPVETSVGRPPAAFLDITLLTRCFAPNCGPAIWS